LVQALQHGSTISWVTSWLCRLPCESAARRPHFGRSSKGQSTRSAPDRQSDPNGGTEQTKWRRPHLGRTNFTGPITFTSPPDSPPHQLAPLAKPRHRTRRRRPRGRPTNLDQRITHSAATASCLGHSTRNAAHPRDPAPQPSPTASQIHKEDSSKPAPPRASAPPRIHVQEVSSCPAALFAIKVAFRR
jgi:hypothetical protein